MQRQYSLFSLEQERMRIPVFIAFLLTAALPSMAQNTTIITLSDTKAEHRPQNFHVTAIEDYRDVKTTIGRINEGSIDLHGGLANGLTEYINKNVEQNSNTLPVTMRINRFAITEKTAGAKRQFELQVSIAYYTGTSKLVEYNGNSFAQSNGEADSYVEKLIRKNIVDNLRDFDTWMDKNKNSISTEPTVEVNVIFSRATENKNHIAYSKTNKLYITDFKGRPDEASPGAAATLSGIGMNMQSSTLRNKTTVDVTVSIYFDKTRSWMKDNGKNITILMHEQRHFDITAIKACELKRLIEQTTFSPANYKTELKELLDKVQNEGADMQNTYDRETEHGTIIDEQGKWNKKIDELLSRQKCY